eukprot:TRINITY_DN11364_c0_g1_i1.p1 TRINITY_DN11364_c0_g1~~TRINITY_DN11364_c0_g1_i1.p1  ORF type:complete len:355 (-),score=59.70 TRINITY_DN11364_c0_g1_i1:28-939(-)
MAKTRFVLPVDMDLAPDVSLRQFLKQSIPWMARHDRVAWVVPHFEHRRCKNESLNVLPETVPELIYQIKRGRIRPFHVELLYWRLNLSNQDFDKDCPKIEREIWPDLVGAAKLTRYRHWIETAQQSDGKFAADAYRLDASLTSSQTDHLHWEPYVVVDRANNLGAIVRYNELFVGRFFNKVSFVTSLRSLGYRFQVLHNHFLIHQKHEASPYQQHLDHLFDPMLKLIEALEDEIRADPHGTRQSKYWLKSSLHRRFLLIPVEVTSQVNLSHVLVLVVVCAIIFVMKSLKIQVQWNSKDVKKNP